MTIRIRLRLVSVLVLGLLIVAFVLAVRFLLISSFVDLEVQEVRKNVERVDYALADEINRVASFNKDWAFWDDTASFVEGGLPPYVTDNLADGSLVAVRINFLVFADAQGRVKATKIIDLASGKSIPCMAP